MANYKTATEVQLEYIHKKETAIKKYKAKAERVLGLNKLICKIIGHDWQAFGKPVLCYHVCRRCNEFRLTE